MKRSLILLSLSASLLAACGQNGPTLTVSPSSATFNAGDDPRAFTATVSGGSGTVVWSLSPATGAGTLLATSGNVTQYTPPQGYTDGATVTLTATLQGTAVSARSVITVNKAYAVSDRHLKTGFRQVDPAQVLAKVAALPLTSWKYTADNAGVRHLGPMAQDFHAAFGLNGSDDQRIAVVDEGGVALAAIQGLYQKNQQLEQQNAALQGQLTVLGQRLARLEQQ